MMKWFKKDPLIHGIITIFSVLLILVILFFAYIGYTVKRFWDPNYIEWGYQIVLYDSKNCPELAMYSMEGPCFLATVLNSMYKNDTKTLDKGIESLINKKKGLFDDPFFKTSLKLNNYSKNGNEWNCIYDNKSGSVNLPILNNSTEIIRHGTYKCWPKQ